MAGILFDLLFQTLSVTKARRLKLDTLHQNLSMRTKQSPAIVASPCVLPFLHVSMGADNG
eukprot:839451-Pelagomonas_calceolata.AAC.2